MGIKAPYPPPPPTPLRVPMKGVMRVHLDGLLVMISLCTHLEEGGVGKLLP